MAPAIPRVTESLTNVINAAVPVHATIIGAKLRPATIVQVNTIRYMFAESVTLVKLNSNK